MILKKKEKKVRTDIKKCNKTRDILQKVLNEAKLNLDELAWVYGQLGYDIGASLEGKAYNLEELEKQYYQNPTIGVAFMIQGLTIQTWITQEQEDGKKGK